MKKNVSIISSIKKKINFYLHCKWWWLYQLNDILGIAGLFLLIVPSVPNWIGIALLIMWGVLILVLSKILENAKNKSGLF